MNSSDAVEGEWERWVVEEGEAEKGEKLSMMCWNVWLVERRWAYGQNVGRR